jgi:predicted Zn-dependent protease
MLERARSLQPSDYFVNLLLGIDLLRTGKAAKAVPFLSLAAHVQPAEEVPEDYLGEAEAALGSYSRAAESYQRALENGHRSDDALEAWAGFALERFHDLGERLRASEAGTAVARRLAEAGGKPAEGGAACYRAIPELERTLAVHRPGSAGATPESENIYRLSICYAEEAGKVSSELQNSAKDPAAVHKLRGDVLLRLKADGPGAEAEYRAALAARAGDPALLERLAEAQMTAGDAEGARQSALAAVAVDPHGREAMRTLSALAMNDRDYEEALLWLQQLSMELPGDSSVQVELAKAQAETGDDVHAAALLGRALAAGYPDEKGALHALLSRVLRKLGRDAEAQKAQAEARRLSDHFQAQAGAPHGGSDAPK